MKKKPEPKEITPELFRTCRDWFITYIQQNIDSGYQFGSSSAIGEGENKKLANIEAMQFKNILKVLVYRVKTKFENISEQDLNIKVFQGLQMIVMFAEQNNYICTAINLKTKLNNIIQHIQNEQRANNNNKGFSPEQNTWISATETLTIYGRTAGLSNTGVRQISNGETGND